MWKSILGEEITNPKLIICDMDGTLLDTAEANYLAYKDAAATRGYDIDRTLFMTRLEGRNYRSFLPEFGITAEEDLAQIHKIKKERYSLYMDRVVVNRQLVDYLKSMKQSCLIALATTASGKNAADILEKTGLITMFDIVVTQEDVKKLKPDPECYRLVMERAFVNPTDTLIFEDSLNGLEAARLSGARVVNVKGWTESNNG